MKMNQVQLTNGSSQVIVWLPVDSRVKEGSIISLEKGGEKWKVEKMYSTVDSESIQRGWGLDLPKSQRTER